MTTSAKAASQAAAPLELSFKPRTRHRDSDRYCIWVYWLIGLSSGTIAKLMLLPRSAVLGVINRSEYRNRSAMSDSERQHCLDELRAIRFEDDGQPFDRGLLDRVSWIVQPLAPTKIRPARRQS